MGDFLKAPSDHRKGVLISRSPWHPQGPRAIGACPGIEGMHFDLSNTTYHLLPSYYASAL